MTLRELLGKRVRLCSTLGSHQLPEPLRSNDWLVGVLTEANPAHLTLKLDSGQEVTVMMHAVATISVDREVKA